jgi:hypothetical protein
METENLTPDEEKQLRGDEPPPETPENSEVPAPKEGEAEIEAEKSAETPEEKPQTGKPPKGFVNYGALHEERERRRAAEQQLNEIREKYARVDERLNFLAQKAQAPNPEDDPYAYARYEQEQLKTELETTKKTLDQQLTEQKQQLEALNFKNFIDGQERVFTARNPDYPQALEHYTKIRMEMMEELGFDPAERNRVLQEELGHFVRQAVRAQKNPAEQVYIMAKKMGFKTSAKPHEKLDSVARGAESRSLGATGGKRAAELTAETLAEMSDEEFSKITDSDFRRIFGA